MARIDFSDILEDDDFRDIFYVIRQSESIDETGRTVDTPTTPQQFDGIIQPASGQTLQLMPDLARTAGAIEVWTETNLQGETDTTSPDIVVWNGDHYTVSHTDPWQNMGRGFTHAVCVRREITDKSKPL